MDYELIRSDRRTIAIQIKADGRMIVRCPRRMSEERVRQFVLEKQDWIKKHTRIKPAEPKFTPTQLQDMKQQALPLLEHRVSEYAFRMGVSYGKVSIRAQKTRWGSCSSCGNLSFNCCLTLVPPEVLDYVVIHELSHRLVPDHSPRFWQTVEKWYPDYRQHRQWLKEHGGALIARL